MWQRRLSVLDPARCMPFFFRNKFEALAIHYVGLSGGLAIDALSLGPGYRRD